MYSYIDSGIIIASRRVERSVQHKRCSRSSPDRVTVVGHSHNLLQFGSVTAVIALVLYECIILCLPQRDPLAPISLTCQSSNLNNASFFCISCRRAFVHVGFISEEEPFSPSFLVFVSLWGFFFLCAYERVVVSSIYMLPQAQHGASNPAQSGETATTSWDHS